MAKLNYDGVVEAVRYTPAGQVEWVRAYERRGPVFSDHVLISRADLVARLKAGKRFLVGQRTTYQGAMFETSQPVQLVAKNGSEVILAGDDSTGHDHLEGVPVI